MSNRLGIIIPTLTEARWLPGCLNSLGDARVPVLVADGGSTDATRTVAAAHRLQPQVLQVTGGRHQQLNVAMAQIVADWVLILPADGRLLPGAIERIASACAGLPGAAACLTLTPDVRAWQHRLRSAWSGLRCRMTGGAYLDQAPLFRRSPALAAGGFRACGSYDSADLGWRLRAHGRFMVVPEPVVMSCREYRQRGFWGATLRHQRLRWRQFRGGAPAALAAPLERLGHA